MVLFMWLMPWGTQLILALQSWSHPLLDLFFTGMTLLGTEGFYMLLLPVLVWCLDKKLGLRVALLVLFSTCLNEALKVLFRFPRPNPEVVRWVVSAGGWGFPSGHAQTTTAVFGYLTLWLRPRRGAMALWLVPPLVSLSRVYLGVHYPHDVIGGMLVGLALVVLFNWMLEGPATRRWEHLRAREQVGVLAAITVGLAVPNLSPYAVTALGALLGIGCGALWERRVVRLARWASVGKQALRLAVGLVFLLLIYGLGKILLPDVPALRFLRYAMLGTAATGVLPWCFLRWGWGESTTERTHASCATP